MSGPSPSWHHAPGDFCTHPDRVFIPDDGPPIEGPWGAPDLPSELPKVDGHWVCPGHDGKERSIDDDRYEELEAEIQRLRWELKVARDPNLRRDLHYCGHCDRTSPDRTHTATGWCPTCRHHCNPGWPGVGGGGWQRG